MLQNNSYAELTEELNAALQLLSQKNAVMRQANAEAEEAQRLQKELCRKKQQLQEVTEKAQAYSGETYDDLQGSVFERKICPFRNELLNSFQNFESELDARINALSDVQKQALHIYEMQAENAAALERRIFYLRLRIKNREF